MFTQILIAALVSVFGSMSISELSYAREVVHFTGKYESSKYHFSIYIPSGLVGLGAAPGAPNHGFAISFGEDEFDYISVFAGYDVAEIEESQAADLKHSAPPGFEVLETRQQRRQLSALNAVKSWQRLRRQSDGKVYISLGIGAKREVDGEKISYSLNLYSPEKLYKERIKIFETIVTTFHLLP